MLQQIVFLAKCNPQPHGSFNVAKGVTRQGVSPFLVIGQTCFDKLCGNPAIRLHPRLAFQVFVLGLDDFPVVLLSYPSSGSYARKKSFLVFF